MKKRILKALTLILIFSVLFPITAAGSPPDPPEIIPLDNEIAVTATSAQTAIDLDSALRTPEGRVSLIVELGAPPLALTNLTNNPDFDVESAASQNYLATLERQKDATILQMMKLVPSAEVGPRYGAAFNGFGVRVAPDEAAALLKLDSVKHIYPDRMRSVLLDSTTEVINAPAFWTDLGGQSTAGEGIRIAVVDTGIRSDHPMFAGDGFTAPPTYPHGYCADFPADPDFQCNDKIIVARYYEPIFDIRNDEVLSPIDTFGHGTHVAGIAAGNPVEVPAGNIVPEATAISGVAPGAYLMIYKAIFVKPDGSAGGSDSMFLTALNDAMLDGADVINNSWGAEIGGDPVDSPFRTATEALNAAGIVVVFGAGNSGPNENTIVCPGCLENVITVGASTADRIFANSIDATSPPIIPDDLIGVAALSGTGPAISTDIEAEIIYSGNAAPLNVEGCNPFGGSDFSGAIALIPRGGCSFFDKVDHAQTAGAVAVAIFDNQLGPLTFMGGLEGTGIPSVFLTQSQGEALRDWIDLTVTPVVRLNAQETAVHNAEWQDILWESSSVGPNGDPNILKPDIVAPGAFVLSAYTSTDGYQFLQGTSMAAPHVAGAAALIIQKHADWDSQQIKTALTSTAYQNVRQPDWITAATPLMIGAGRLDLAQARNAGVTFSQPSFANGLCSTQCSWQAEIKNESLLTAWWEVTVNAPIGMKIDVDPSEVILELGESHTFTVTADVSDLATDQWYFANIEWEHRNGGSSNAHLPLAAFVVEPDQAQLEKSVDLPKAGPGDTASYTITLINDAPLTTTFFIQDPIPDNASYITSTATGGLFYDSGMNELFGTIELDNVQMILAPDSLHGYIPLAPYTSPQPCPGNDCDDAAYALSGFDFYYLGQHITNLVWSTNGFLQVGANIPDGTALNQNFPDPTVPNNVLAPLWADLDLDGCTASGRSSAWYRIFAQVSNVNYYIFEWENAALKSDSTACFTFQVWIKTGTNEIWFVYGPQTGTINTATVGIENQYGSAGDIYFYNGTGTSPVEGTTLKAINSIDQAVFTYQLAIGPEIGVDVINTVEATNDRTGRVISASARVQVGEQAYLPIVIR